MSPLRKAFNAFILLLVIILIVSYAVWTGQRPASLYLSDLRIQLAVNEGQPADRGNLLGIQTELVPGDYQSRDKKRHEKQQTNKGRNLANDGGHRLALKLGIGGRVCGFLIENSVMGLLLAVL